jgi:hypothetical protein
MRPLKNNGWRPLYIVKEQQQKKTLLAAGLS